MVAIDFNRDSSALIVAITNDGEVPLAIRERFFEKYVTYGKNSGTGLGTYSAWLAIRTQGGTIQLNCKVKGKTTVTFTLPLQSAAQSV